ncbi:hypothetical protein AB0N29_01780 [Nocardioides sp. NPDC092400]|uniref:hypothetical protein n=1 Tax=Nocardioides sp. NPDC092400 TaxID=3155196 RepID=UPI003415BB11
MTGAVTWVTAGTAAAETTTFRDGPGKDRQGPANSLAWVRVQYAEKPRVVWTLKVEKLVKNNTRAFATIYWPDDSTIRLETKHKNGTLKVKGYDSATETTFRDGLTARWNYQRDTVTFVLTSHLRPWNERAVFDGFTVMKGAFHGPHCEPAPATGTCNDDWATGRVEKG